MMKRSIKRYSLEVQVQQKMTNPFLQWITTTSTVVVLVVVVGMLLLSFATTTTTNAYFTSGGGGGGGGVVVAFTINQKNNYHSYHHENTLLTTRVPTITFSTTAGLKTTRRNGSVVSKAFMTTQKRADDNHDTKTKINEQQDHSSSRHQPMISKTITTAASAAEKTSTTSASATTTPPTKTKTFTPLSLASIYSQNPMTLNNNNNNNNNSSNVVVNHHHHHSGGTATSSTTSTENVRTNGMITKNGITNTTLSTTSTIGTMKQNSILPMMMNQNEEEKHKTSMDDTKNDSFVVSNLNRMNGTTTTFEKDSNVIGRKEEMNHHQNNNNNNNNSTSTSTSTSTMETKKTMDLTTPTTTNTINTINKIPFPGKARTTTTTSPIPIQTASAAVIPPPLPPPPATTSAAPIPLPKVPAEAEATAVAAAKTTATAPIPIQTISAATTTPPIPLPTTTTASPITAIEKTPILETFGSLPTTTTTTMPAIPTVSSSESESSGVTVTVKVSAARTAAKTTVVVETLGGSENENPRTQTVDGIIDSEISSVVVEEDDDNDDDVVVSSSRLTSTNEKMNMSFVQESVPFYKGNNKSTTTASTSAPAIASTPDTADDSKINFNDVETTFDDTTSIAGSSSSSSTQQMESEKTNRVSSSVGGVGTVDKKDTAFAYTIRDCKYTELGEVARIIIDAFYDTKTISNFMYKNMYYMGELNRIQQGFSYGDDCNVHKMFVATTKDNKNNDEIIIGFVDIDLRPPSWNKMGSFRYNPRPYLSDLCVDPKYQRLGIGQQLVQYCEQYCTTMVDEESIQKVNLQLKSLGALGASFNNHGPHRESFHQRMIQKNEMYIRVEKRNVAAVQLYENVGYQYIENPDDPMNTNYIMMYKKQ